MKTLKRLWLWYWHAVLHPVNDEEKREEVRGW